MLRRSGTTAVLLTLLMLLGACTSNTEAGAPSVEAEEPPADTGGDSGLLAQPTAPVEAPTEPSAEPAAEQPAEPSPAPTEASAPESAQVDLTVLNIALEPVAGGLRSPIGLAHAGDGSRRLFVVEKDGTIRIIQDGQLLPQPFLDITDRVGSSGSEQGLLGLAFHPEYASTGFFFVNYTDAAGNTVVSRFRVTEDPNRADPASEEVVLTQEQPASNHNGGHLAFGPDGYLYIGLGDGGGAGDVFGQGQNPHTWLGSMLRIDVDTLPYSVPPDNPFVGTSDGADEVWAYGLRNPWRYSFDRATNNLYIADVGQNVYEEVNVQPAGSTGGENYGWPIMEGLHCYPEGVSCDGSGFVQPIAEYSHEFGCSITGGYVYRGEAFPAMQGVYFYGDFCSGIIWGLAVEGSMSGESMQLADTDTWIASFGEDEAGELYLADMGGGMVYRVVAR
ncbi:MAG: PQQ-dependent sugar dehydrogenase [Aggregatilineales bacterium]|nr:glucose dehydrogenase [Chloroflexota bacterium]HOA24928.1 PQQ-dependent sugar dehydrogenase [Aggregatilineales bacterium]HPV05556.1 PQQ-dependent sugar dehydrogenase [Aggregatilineales bacterium]